MKIAIGGMIAAGKTTLLNNLKNDPDFKGIKVVDEFRNDDECFDTMLRWLYEKKENVEMLLQVYFINKHWLFQKEVNDNEHCIVDRHIIEHWLFAQENLKNNKHVLNFYNSLFHAYMNEIKHPDLYIILDISWETFVERIFKRSRKAEIDNFKSNEKYFKNLLENYTKKLIAQCEIYNINYVVINVNDLNSNQIFKEAKNEINSHKLKIIFDYLKN